LADKLLKEMIEFHSNVEEAWIEAKIRGKIEATDFEKIEPVADGLIEHEGKLKGLVLNVTEFSGWESLNALLTHLKFVKAHHRYLERVALVGNRQWQEAVPKLASIFVAATLKFFPEENLDEARAWVRNVGQ
jgi:hypothetical protein